MKNQPQNPSPPWKKHEEKLREMDDYMNAAIALLKFDEGVCYASPRFLQLLDTPQAVAAQLEQHEIIPLANLVPDEQHSHYYYHRDLLYNLLEEHSLKFCTEYQFFTEWYMLRRSRPSIRLYIRFYVLETGRQHVPRYIVMVLTPAVSQDNHLSDGCIEHLKSGSLIQLQPEKQESGLKLTSREEEVLLLFLSGKTSLQVAESLFISMDTVRTHRQNIRRKCNAQNMLQAISHYLGMLNELRIEN